MSLRELIVLGTASAVPTRRRNHNGYVLRWDGTGLLFDPGEGTQRQMLLAGLSAHDLNRICISHFHGDHSLGVSGVVQRIARDKVQHEIHASFPASGEHFWRRLRHATSFVDTEVIAEVPISGEFATIQNEPFTLTAQRLDHSIETYGYRLVEPDGRTMIPEKLAAAGVRGPAISELQKSGEVTTSDGRTVSLDECSVRRPGQIFAFIMDTRLCDAAFALAADADLLVIESTYLDSEAELATAYRHLTASQAGRIAAESGVRTLVLTHFSERYDESADALFAEQAREFFTGELILAQDGLRVPFPSRRQG